MFCVLCEFSHKKNIDWDERKRKLDELLNSIKSSNEYDIIIPASGGKDSMYACNVLSKGT